METQSLVAGFTVPVCTLENWIGGRMSTGRDCLMLFKIQSCPWSPEYAVGAQAIYPFLMLKFSLKREQVEILCLSVPVETL